MSTRSGVLPDRVVETPPGWDLFDPAPLERLRLGNNHPGKDGHLTNRVSDGFQTERS